MVVDGDDRPTVDRLDADCDALGRCRTISTRSQLPAEASGALRRASASHRAGPAPCGRRDRSSSSLAPPRRGPAPTRAPSRSTGASCSPSREAREDRGRGRRTRVLAALARRGGTQSLPSTSWRRATRATCSALRRSAVRRPRARRRARFAASGTPSSRLRAENALRVRVRRRAPRRGCFRPWRRGECRRGRALRRNSREGQGGCRPIPDHVPRRRRGFDVQCGTRSLAQNKIDRGEGRAEARRAREILRESTAA